MELTNEEKAKVAAMYWGVEAFHLEGYGYGEFATIHSMHVDMMGAGTYKCCLGLTPISAITDEHAIEVAKIINPHTRIEIAIANGKHAASKVMDITMEHGSTGMAIYTYQYLISKGYDVPIFFGVGHWANGKTAIELGIAIDKEVAA